MTRTHTVAASAAAFMLAACASAATPPAPAPATQAAPPAAAQENSPPTAQADAPIAVQEDSRVAVQDEFWARLQALCESAAEGRLLQAPPGDTQIDPDATLVVHFRECGDTELRFPLHVGENRSRTWVFIRHDDSLELRHDHRHEDGSEESNTWYGASTLDSGSAARQEFVTERNGMRFGWRVEIEPGRRYTYGTIRNGEWRHHLEFDLTRPATIPPPPWGHETRPSQRPTPSGQRR